MVVARGLYLARHLFILSMHWALIQTKQRFSQTFLPLSFMQDPRKKCDKPWFLCDSRNQDLRVFDIQQQSFWGFYIFLSKIVRLDFGKKCSWFVHGQWPQSFRLLSLYRSILATSRWFCESQYCAWSHTCSGLYLGLDLCQGSPTHCWAACLRGRAVLCMNGFGSPSQISFWKYLPDCLILTT